MKIFEIRAAAEVIQQGNGTGLRRRSANTATGRQLLTFGKEPTYLRCDELPLEIAADELLRKEEVTEAQIRAGATVINLQPAPPAESLTGGDPPPPPDSTRQQPTGAAPAEADLKPERVQQPAAAAKASARPAADELLRKEEVTEAQIRAGATVINLQPAPPAESLTDGEPNPGGTGQQPAGEAPTETGLKPERVQQPAAAAKSKARPVPRARGRKPRRNQRTAKGPVSPETAGQ